MRSDWDDGLDARHLIFRAPTPPAAGDTGTMTSWPSSCTPTAVPCSSIRA